MAISSVSGTLSHGSALTITGSGFGTKSLAQQIWDDCEGTDVTTIWDDCVPNTNATYNIGYRATQRGVALPHSHGSKYIAGCHFDTSNDFNRVWVQSPPYTPSAYPYYETLHYWWRVDPAWQFGNNGGDDNFKLHSPGNNPQTSDFWYMEFEVFSFNGPSANNIILDVSDSGSLGYRCVTADVGACHSTIATVGYGVEGMISPAEEWVHYKLQIRWDRASSGWVRLWENGVQKFGTNGATDQDTDTTTRVNTVGSYSRSRSSDNWRYFKDIYSDRGPDALALVEIGSGSTYATSGNKEPQPITSWSDTSIGITLNDGALGGLSGKYLYVTDSAGTVNSNGFLLTDSAAPKCWPGVRA